MIRQRRHEEDATDANGIEGYNTSTADGQGGRRMVGIKQVKVTSVVVKGKGIVAQTKTTRLSGGGRRRRIQQPR